MSAGPGSGKTKVIAHRVKFLIEKKNIPPRKILCLTFTNAGAETMKERLESMKIDTTDLTITTYHSFCTNTLRDFSISSAVGAGRIVNRSSFLVWGLDNIDSFGFDSWLDISKISSITSAADLIEKLIDGISTFKDELIKPEEIQRYVKKELAKITGDSDAEEVQKIHELDNLVKIYKKYDEYKRKQGVLDFDDLIVLTNELLDDPKKKHVLNHLQNKYEHILIDEFQDNNYAQFSIIKKLVTKGNVTAVGDDDQSIYRFQGAYPEIFKDFMKSFKGAKMILLKKNYRNIKSVVALSSWLLKQDITRSPKALVSDKKSKDKVSVVACEGEFAQAHFVKSKILELKKKNPKLGFSDFTVLSRTQRGGLPIANLLTSAGIPVNYVGKSNIFASSSARSLISYLSIISEPQNSGKYINQILENHGVSDNDIAIINHEAKRRAWHATNNDCVLQVVFDLKLQKVRKDLFGGKYKMVQPKLANPQQIHSIGSLLKDLIKVAKDSTTVKTINEVLRVRTDIFKKTTYDDSFENYIERSVLISLQENSNDLQTLKPDCSIKDFLNYIQALEKFEVETEQGSEFSDSVQVSTIHQSKGKEFAHVFVINVGDRQIPLSATKKMFYVPKGLAKALYPALDPKEFFKNEERRLLYVAMTRAIDNLYISWSARVEASGNARKASDFLVKLYEQEPKRAWEPNVDYTPEYTATGTGQSTANPIDIVRNEIVDLALKNITTGQYDSAVQALVDLDAVRQYKSKKTTTGSKLTKTLKIKPTSKLDKRLQGIKINNINISNLTMSATRFKSYKSCPKKFKFEYIWKVPSGTFSAAMYKGSVFHNIVQKAGEAQMQGNLLSQKDLEKMFADEWDYTKFLDQSKTEERDGRTNVKQMLGEYEKWAKSSKNKVIDIEKNFTVELFGVNVTGKIDRVEETPEGDLIVYDYKTGMSQGGGVSTDIQLNVYCLACTKLYGKLPKKAILFYPMIPEAGIVRGTVTLKRFREYKVKQETVDATINKLEELVKSIKKLDFTAKPTTRECGYCDYRNICTEAI